jgi:hypothetical protein
MRDRVKVLLATVTILAGCEDPAGSELGPSLRILAGSNVTDTITFAPAQGLVVQVRGEGGRPEADVQVRFESTSDSNMAVASIAQASWTMVVGATTDVNGRATIRVRLGSRAGPGWVAISVPLFGLTDSARYVIQPGSPVRVVLSPKDTTIALGTNFMYRGTVADRAGNPLLDPAVFEAAGSAVSMTSSGTTTAVAYGIAKVRVRASIGQTSVSDSGTVAVVPDATIAGVDGLNTIATSMLTGANNRSLNANGIALSWEPGGPRLVATHSGLVIVDAQGNGTPLTTAGFDDSTWPEWASDGFIYFNGLVQGVQTVARIRPDGTDLQALTQGVPSEMPSPSPDGTRIVFVDRSAGQLVVHNLQSGARTTLSATQGAQAPRWSPDGAWIAYTKGSYYGELMLIRPDGSGLRRIGEHGLDAGITWSTDSKWILGSDFQATLVDVTSGKMMYLPYYKRYLAWKR